MSPTDTEIPGPHDALETLALFEPVLGDLADLMARVPEGSLSRATPCSEYDVSALRQHILGWVTYFAAALADPEAHAPRPDPGAFVAPADPSHAASIVREAATSILASIAGGVLDRPVLMVRATMPGRSIVGMSLWEYQVHGWDLARALGEQWQPPVAALEASLAFAPSMLSPQYRGPGKTFAAEVPVPVDAPALDRLLGFSGRNPAWAPEV